MIRIGMKIVLYNNNYDNENNFDDNNDNKGEKEK